MYKHGFIAGLPRSHAGEPIDANILQWGGLCSCSGICSPFRWEAIPHKGVRVMQNYCNSGSKNRLDWCSSTTDNGSLSKMTNVKYIWTHRSNRWFHMRMLCHSFMHFIMYKLTSLLQMAICLYFNILSNNYFLFRAPIKFSDAHTAIQVSYDSADVNFSGIICVIITASSVSHAAPVIGTGLIAQWIIIDENRLQKQSTAVIQLK